MCVGDVSTQPTGAPYPACASGLSTRSVTPGAPRALSACWRQVGANPRRIEFVPMTVMGLPLSPWAGMKPVASPVAWIWIGFCEFIVCFKYSRPSSGRASASARPPDVSFLHEQLPIRNARRIADERRHGQLLRRARDAEQLQAGFVRQTVALAGVHVLAGPHQVF